MQQTPFHKSDYCNISFDNKNLEAVYGKKRSFL